MRITIHVHEQQKPARMPPAAITDQLNRSRYLASLSGLIFKGATIELVKL